LGSNSGKNQARHRFADKAPEQVWAILLDEGTYLELVKGFV
jgi:hypothetical protein